MENLYYNGVNIIDLAKRKKPQIYSVVSDFRMALFVAEIISGPVPCGAEFFLRYGRLGALWP